MKTEKTSLAMYTGDGGLSPEMVIRKEEAEPIDIDGVLLELTQVVGMFVLAMMVLIRIAL